MFVPRVNIALLLILLGFCIAAPAQREVTLIRRLTAQCNNPDYRLNQCDYGLLVPAPMPGKQEVLSYAYPGVKPQHVSKTETNDYYLQWKKVPFGAKGESFMEVRIRLKISEYDLYHARKKPVMDKTDLDTLRYLKDEENFRFKAARIQSELGNIKSGSREDMVRQIFEFVGRSLDYHIYLQQDRGAKQALKDGQGDCTEYSELMVTLCRGKAIPARIVQGLIVHASGIPGYHNWVEVFFPQYGWVAFDPTWADSPRSTTSFEHMRNCYIRECHRRFVKTIVCPAYGSFPFSLKFRDSIIVYNGDHLAKMKQVKRLYENGKIDAADSLADSLQFVEEDDLLYIMKANIKMRQDRLDLALENLNKARDLSYTAAQLQNTFYAYGRYYALKNEADSAAHYLRQSLKMGFSDYPKALGDMHFVSLWKHSSFAELRKELEQLQEQKEKSTKSD